MKQNLPVTVAIPVKNEEEILGRCLARLARFQRVVVIDSDSRDRTAEIAREYAAEVIQFAWDGQYPKKRNWFLLNYPISTPWILFLDADELVDDSFCDAVRRAIADDKYAGFWLKYTNYFMGARLRYGLPQRKLALFRCGRGLYERIDENGWSGLDMEVHEHPAIYGKVGGISVPIDHNDDRGIVRFIDRHREYALWEAKRSLRLNSRNAGAAAPRLTIRQRTKYALIASWWYPAFYFLYTYIARLGFLDGRAGLAYAVMKLWYFTTIQVRIKELKANSGALAQSEPLMS